MPGVQSAARSVMAPPRWRADWVVGVCAARSYVRRGVRAGTGCVKTQILRVLRGLFTIPAVSIA
jgi:hypothetical protein